MPISIAFLFLLIALVLFILSGLGVSGGRVNLQSMGLAAMVLAFMLAGIPQ